MVKFKYILYVCIKKKKENQETKETKKQKLHSSVFLGSGSSDNMVAL